MKIIPLRCLAVDELPRVSDGSGSVDVHRLPPPRGGIASRGGMSQVQITFGSSGGGGSGGGGSQRRMLLSNRPATSFEMKNGRLRRLGRNSQTSEVYNKHQTGGWRNFPHLAVESERGRGNEARSGDFGLGSSGSKRPSTKGEYTFQGVNKAPNTPSEFKDFPTFSDAGSDGGNTQAGFADHTDSENTMPNPAPSQQAARQWRQRQGQHGQRRSADSRVRPPLSPTNLEERQQQQQQQRHQDHYMRNNSRNLPNMTDGSIAVARNGAAGSMIKPIAMAQYPQSTRVRASSGDAMAIGSRSRADSGAGLGSGLGGSKIVPGETQPFEIGSSSGVSHLEHTFSRWTIDVCTDQGPHHANEDRWMVVDDLAALAAGGHLEPVGTGSGNSFDNGSCPRAFLRPQGTGRQPMSSSATAAGNGQAANARGGAASHAMRTSLWGVFDGHGGSGASEYVRTRAALEVVKGGGLGDLLENRGETVQERMETVLQAAFAQLEDGFTRHAKQRDESGACVTLVLCRAGNIAVANVGDCRAMLFNCRLDQGRNGKTPVVTRVHELTTPHRASDASERKRIMAAGGCVVNGRVMGVLEPSRAIGDLDLKRIPTAQHAVSAVPDVKGARLYNPSSTPLSCPAVGSAPRSKFGGFSGTGAASRSRNLISRGTEDANTPPFMVLASDGLWDFVRANRVGEIVSAASRIGGWDTAPDDVAKRLTTEARACGSQDDITIVVVRFIE